MLGEAAAFADAVGAELERVVERHRIVVAAGAQAVMHLQPLEASGLWAPEQAEALKDEIQQEINEAARIAEQVPPPGLETIFSDVYEEVPEHLRKQGRATFELASRKGDAQAGDGAFPL